MQLSVLVEGLDGVVVAADPALSVAVPRRWRRRRRRPRRARRANGSSSSPYTPSSCRLIRTSTMRSQVSRTYVNGDYTISGSARGCG